MSRGNLNANDDFLIRPRTTGNQGIIAATINVANGKLINLTEGEFNSDSVLAGNSVNIKGISVHKTLLTKTSGGPLLDIEKANTVLGTALLTGSSLTEIAITGATFTVDQHKGKVVSILSTGNQPQKRWVLSNTATTLTLEEPLHNVPAGGETVEINDAIDEVTLSDFSIDGNGQASAGILVRYARRVIIDNVSVIGCGGNGITIDTCKNVVINKTYTASNQFNIFVLNSEDVRVKSSISVNANNSYLIQLKDCIRSKIVNCIGEGGQNGFNLKCSGLNPSYQCEILGSSVTGCSQAGLYAHSILEEGTSFKASDFSINNCTSTNCVTGLRTFGVGSEDMFNTLTISNIKISGATSVGLGADAIGAIYRDITIVKSEIYSATITGTGQTFINLQIVDSNMNQSVGFREAVRTFGVGNDTLFVNANFKVTDPLSRSNRFIREMDDGQNLTLQGLHIDDSQGVVTTDVLQSIGSTSVSRAYIDQWVASSIISKLSSDNFKHVVLTAATAISETTRNVFVNVTSATTHNLSPSSDFVDKYVTIMNVSSTASITLDPFASETIDGGNPSIVLAPNEAITITNFTGSSDIKIIARN